MLAHRRFAALAVHHRPWYSWPSLVRRCCCPRPRRSAVGATPARPRRRGRRPDAGRVAPAARSQLPAEARVAHQPLNPRASDPAAGTSRSSAHARERTSRRTACISRPGRHQPRRAAPATGPGSPKRETPSGTPRARGCRDRCPVVWRRDRATSPFPPPWRRDHRAVQISRSSARPQLATYRRAPHARAGQPLLRALDRRRPVALSPQLAATPARTQRALRWSRRATACNDLFVLTYCARQVFA